MSRAFRRRLGRYLTVGVLSLVVDVAVLTFSREVVDTPVWLAASAGFGSAFLVNFLLNLHWSFDVNGMLAGRLARYLVLVGVNYLLTLTLVAGLSAAGLFYLLAKSVAVVVCVALNFVAYDRWVFART